MSLEIEETVAEGVEEMALEDALNEDEKMTSGREPHWAKWVALSSSLFAILSAVAALLATLASDQAVMALSEQSNYAAYMEGADTSREILKNKLDILHTLGRSVTDADRAELQKLDARFTEFETRKREFEKNAADELKVHDYLAIAVTFFQVSILMGGLAVVVKRVAVWCLGLIFSLIGSAYLFIGLVGYMK